MKLQDRVLSAVAAAFAISLFLATPATAWAGTMAGLKFDAGDSMDSRVSSAVRDSVVDAFDDVDNWSFKGFRETRNRLDPVVRDCFTSDCLGKVQDEMGAEVGLTVTITGEAQIYNWTLTFYNLYSGEEMKSRTGTCELCGRAEVERTFRESLKAALIGTATPRDPQAAGTPENSGSSTARPDTGAQIALRVSVVPKEATITLDGEKMGAGDVTEAVSPGEHVVGFKLEGFQGLRETVIVDENTNGPVLLRVHLSRTDPETVTVAGAQGPVDRLGSNKRNLYGAISTGTGVVLLGTGIYLASIDGEPACSDGVAESECPEIYATGGAGMTLGVLGTAAISTGVTLLIWEVLAGSPGEDTAGDSGDSPDAGDDTGPEVRFGPSLAPGGGGGFLLRGRF